VSFRLIPARCFKWAQCADNIVLAEAAPLTISMSIGDILCMVSTVIVPSRKNCIQPTAFKLALAACNMS